MGYIKKTFSNIKLQYSKNRSVVKNSAWIIADKIYIMIVGVVVTALIARYFGAEQYGVFSYSLSIVTIFTAFSTLGLPVLTVKSLVDKEFSENEIMSSSLILRFIGSVLLMGLALLTITILEPNDTKYTIIVLILSLSMTFKSFEVIDYWLQTYHLAKVSSIIKIISYTLISVLKIGVIVTARNLYIYSMLYTFDALINGIFLLFAYIMLKKKNFRFKLSKVYMKYILSNSWYLIISGLMISIYMQIDKIMLGVMLTNKVQVGLYSVATQIAQMWFFIPMAIITSMQPVILNAKKTNLLIYKDKMRALYRIITILGVIFGLFIVLFSSLIINLLYGKEYAQAASILTISVWAGTFAILGSARNIWLISENLQRYTIAFMGIGAIVNVILNYTLIPLLNGYGAAIATLISQVVVVIFAPLIWKKTRTSTILIVSSLYKMKRSK